MRRCARRVFIVWCFNFAELKFIAEIFCEKWRQTTPNTAISSVAYVLLFAPSDYGSRHVRRHR
jgi:hypothetical protein